MKNHFFKILKEDILKEEILKEGESMVKSFFDAEADYTTK